MGYTKEDIIDLVMENDVKFIRLQFTDLFGSLKNVAVTASQLGKVLHNECMLDGSSIEGFLRIEESDMYLRPDLDTFVIFPWRPQHGKVARFLCDVYTTDGQPFASSPRQLLRQVTQRAARMGYTLQVGPECEFFLFQTDEQGRPTAIPHDRAGYFDLSPVDLGENARREICLTLEEMGFEIESSHHESAPGQNEVDFHYQNALQAADSIQTLKLVVKTVAQRNGLAASFMPKPLNGINGSGMHINLSLEKEGKNVFYDPAGPLGLSKTAYHFLGGIFAHVRGMTLLTNPLVNSYKRLCSGYEAPRYLAWSLANRSHLVRVPKSKPENTRLELRSPDPACNPYLAFAALLEAGLAGMEEEIWPPQPVDGNIFALTQQERQKLGIGALPLDLGEAIDAFLADPLMQQVLGKELSEKYVAAKQHEWDTYRTAVTDWEWNRYFGVY